MQLNLPHTENSPFLIFWIGVSEAPLVLTGRLILDVGSFGDESMVGVPLGEYVNRELPKLCRRPSRRLLSMAAWSSLGLLSPLLSHSYGYRYFMYLQESTLCLSPAGKANKNALRASLKKINLFNETVLEADVILLYIYFILSLQLYLKLSRH